MSDPRCMFSFREEEGHCVLQRQCMLVEDEDVDRSVECRWYENTASKDEAECFPVFVAWARLHLLIKSNVSESVTLEECIRLPYTERPSSSHKG